MVELIRNIGQWLANNKDGIIAVVTSTQFGGFIAALVMLIKNKKATKDNTAQTAKLDETIKENKALTEKVNNLEACIYEQNKILADFKDYVVSTTKTNAEDFAIMQEKMNSMIDASSVAWSTIRDEDIRKNVNNILTTAKYREAGKLKDVQDNVVNLQKELLELTNKLQEQIKLNSEKVVKEVEFQPTEETDNFDDVRRV